MEKLYKKYMVVFLLTVFSVTTSAQQNFFRNGNENAIQANSTGKRVIVPNKYRTVSLDFATIKNFLWSLPSEKNVDHLQAPILELPMPDGTTAKFRVWESSIQEPGLEAKFPDIKTFAGQGIDDPFATIRFDHTPSGFHAQVLTINGKGSYYIDPYARGEVNNYISYFRTDLIKANSFLCEVPDGPNPQSIVAAACRGGELRTYRLAVACTGEYAQAPGVAAGTNPAILHAAIVTTVNRVVGVYEKEISVRLVLIANNNLVEFLNAATDPFNGNNNANTLINESQTVIDANIGTANYDIGHTFSTGGGGLAQLNSPCGNSKARGITGSPSPTGDAYDIDYVAHEMGHQFGGNHSMSGCGSSPNSTKYEVGSGTTIQAYAGICSGENIQPNSDPFFHAISFDEISNFVSGTGSGCGVATATGNNIPVITALANGGLTIPVSTPFTLTGTATDPDGDAVSYCWEQWDFNAGGGVTWNAGATAAAGNTVPLFKSRLPKTTGSRTFPDMAVILAGFPANPPSAMNGLKGETLSPVARPMKFKLTVRDNKAGGGGVASSGAGGCQTNTTFQINVAGTAPFLVTVPNGGESYSGGSTQTVTWNVAGTNAAPFSVSDVKISFSTDGGLTYPTVLAASTANDGSEALTIPAGATTTARIKVEAVGNIFFDISNANFSVTAATGTFDFTTPANANITCGTATSADITLPTISNGGYNVPINLVATGNPAGTTVTYSVNPVTPGNNTVVTFNNVNTIAPGTYPITITGTSGAIVRTVTLTYVVAPGAGPVISAQPTTTPVCAGSNKTISVTATGNLSYQWEQSPTGVGGPWSSVANGGVYSGATTNTLTITGTTTAMSGTAYRVVLPGLCATTTSNAVVLTVNPLPAVAAFAAPDAICIGETSTLTASGANTYAWSAGTTPATGAVVTVTPTGTTNYTVTGTTTVSGCTNTATVTVTAKPKPTITLTAAPYTSLMPGWVTTLTVNITPVVATNNIVWYKNGVIIPGASGATRTVTVDELGDYSVSVTSPFSCPGESSSLRIKDSASNKLFISPNPNNGLFKIRYYTNYLNFGFLRTVLIYDSKGAIVYNKRIPITAPYSAMDIDMRRNGKGIYAVVLADSKGKPLAQGKVVIQ